MKALISPEEKVLNPNTQVELGVRVVDVAATSFDVALPLFWVDCPDGTNSSTHYFDLVAGEFFSIPEAVEPEMSPEVLARIQARSQA